MECFGEMTELLSRKKLLEAIEGEELIECIDLKDGDGNPINDQDVVDMVTGIYNMAIDNCVNIVKDMDSER